MHQLLPTLLSTYPVPPILTIARLTAAALASDVPWTRCGGCVGGECHDPTRRPSCCVDATALRSPRRGPTSAEGRERADHDPQPGRQRDRATHHRRLRPSH